MAESEALVSERPAGARWPKVADRTPAASDLFDLAAHRLNTPLSCIHGFASTLLERGDELDPQTRRQFLEVVLEQAERLEVLGRDLLTFARLRTGTTPAWKEVVPRDLLATLGDESRADGPRITLEGDLDALVRVDPDLLLLAVRPMAENAVAYGPRLGRVRIVATVGQDVLRWAVVDDGTWLDPAELPELFVPFRRSEEPLERRGSGAGLGLAVASACATVLGGSVGAGVDEHGTTFWVETPAEPRGEAGP